MNLVPSQGLVFDPNHESPDVIDERPPNDPTRQQTGGSVPVIVSPGDAQPVLETDPQVPILSGWNIWDVYQSQAPIEPTPGTLDQQLKDWINVAVDAGVDVQPSIVSSRAAGDVIATRSSFPELAGPLHLGVGGSTVFKRTVAFHNPGERGARPWPHDTNTVLDSVYLAAPAPSSPVPAPASQASGGGLMLALGVGLAAILLLRGRKRR